jgi:hypothetical protein
MEHAEIEVATIKRRRDIARFTGITALNVSAMIFSGFRGASTMNGALMAEMSHDLGDASVNGARTYAFWRHMSETRLRAFRTASYAVVSTLGVVASLKSGTDLFHAISNFDGWNNARDNLDSVANGIVIAGLNQGSYVVSQNFESGGELTSDAKHHAHIDRNASLGLAGTLVVGSVVPCVAEVGGIAMGAYTAWHMRPTTKNLQTHTH